MIKTVIRFAVATLLGAAALVTNGASAQAEGVKLRSAFFGVQSRYGCTQDSASFDILTTTFGYDKNVYVHLKERDGSWTDLPATYLESLPDGRELWRASVTYGAGACPTPRTAPSVFQFALKVVPASGGESWDNNGGNDYVAAAKSGAYLADNETLLDFSYVGTNSDGSHYLLLAAFVKNLAYSKSVDVVYTTDAWKTVQSAPLGYSGATYIVGYGSYQNPNENGAERWNGMSPSASAACFEFAIRYRVSGQEYWDNNFGRNYRTCAAQ